MACLKCQFHHYLSLFYGEMDFNIPNPLTIQRKCCILHSELSHPCTKITIFREIQGVFTSKKFTSESDFY